MLLKERLSEFEWLANPTICYCFIRLLLKAREADGNVMGLFVRRGQMITSRKALSAELSLSEQVIRTCLSKLQDTGYINQQTTNKYTIITICNYDSWSVCGNPSNQQITNKQQTNNQQITNNPVVTEQPLFAETEVEQEPLSEKLKIATFNYKEFEEFFNRTLDMNHSRIPKVRKLDDRRKNKLHARMMDYGLESIYEVTEKAAKSSFLNGGGNKGWKADFDWIFGPDNFRKVLEGKYQDAESFTVSATNPESEPQTSKIGWQ